MWGRRTGVGVWVWLGVAVMCCGRWDDNVVEVGSVGVGSCWLAASVWVWVSVLVLVWLWVWVSVGVGWDGGWG